MEKGVGREGGRMEWREGEEGRRAMAGSIIIRLLCRTGKEDVVEKD